MEEMALLSTKKFTNILGMTTELLQASTRDKWLRKKYIGV